MELLCPSCGEGTLQPVSEGGAGGYTLCCSLCGERHQLKPLKPSTEEIREVYRLSQQEVQRLIPEAKRGRSKKAGRRRMKPAQKYRWPPYLT